MRRPSSSPSCWAPRFPPSGTGRCSCSSSASPSRPSWAGAWRAVRLDVLMHPLTESDIRNSLVNASAGDGARMTLPGLHEVLWEQREYLGWRDPKAPPRDYLVQGRDGEPIGMMLRAADNRMKPGMNAMCSLCQTPRPA